MPETVFDVVPKDPKAKHVTTQVKPSNIHEHVCKQG